MNDHAYSDAERAAIYRVIGERRDMRHFAGGQVAPELLGRLLAAAHQAPSVGLMQPWRFIRITQRDLRGRIQALVEAERVRTAEALGVQNLWLAARGEGLGMGWVSLFDPLALAALLGMPAGAKPVAVLCLGPVAEFYPVPMLVQESWAEERPLSEMLYENQWGERQ